MIYFESKSEHENLSPKVKRRFFCQLIQWLQLLQLIYSLILSPLRLIPIGRIVRCPRDKKARHPCAGDEEFEPCSWSRSDYGSTESR